MGYGDITPVHFSEKIVAMFGIFVGVTIFAFVTSSVSNLLLTMTSRSIKSDDMQQKVDSFCRSHELPQILAKKLCSYYAYVFPRRVHTEDLALVEGLSATLRQQVWCCF